MIGDLLLLSGNDIPFPEARVNIHQPTLKEIAYIGEETFFIGCGFLNFSKKLLSAEDKVRLENYNDFDILMSIIINRTTDTQKSIDAAMLVLTLIFPLYEISVRDNLIVLKQGTQEFFINRNNFSAFKEILVSMFNLTLGEKAEDQYNPSGDMAKRIADKLKKRHEQLNKLANINVSVEEKKIAILSRYASILAVGGHKDFNQLMQYTVCQLYDEFQRFQLKLQWDAYIQARMAGAKDLEEVDNWMIDLSEQGKNKNKK
jgi:hypothetical protein